MSNMLKTTLGLAMATATIAVAITPVSVNAWSDGQVGGRPSYSVDQINGGVLGKKIVFNTITNAPMGNEKNFVGARKIDGAKDTSGKYIWNGNEITVEKNKDYVVRLYVHNNNPNGWNAVAKDTTVMINFGAKKALSTKVGGYITSSNAVPNWYYDDVTFKSDKPFKLAYVEGSALLENNGIGKNGGVKLSDDIVKKGGVKIGYNSLNGDVPGCFQFDNYVTIKVRPIFDDTSEFSVKKFVRNSGTKEWHDSIVSKVGDRVQYGILFKNETVTMQMNDVMIKDVLPKNVKYIPGTTMIYNSNHKNGIKVSDNVVSKGINIGKYRAGANAWVVFDVEVIDNGLYCGVTRVRNWGQAGVAKTTRQDYADLLVQKSCASVNELPQTGPATGIFSVLGLGSLVTAAGYYVASRKKM